MGDDQFRQLIVSELAKLNLSTSGTMRTLQKRYQDAVENLPKDNTTKKAEKTIMTSKCKSKSKLQDMKDTETVEKSDVFINNGKKELSFKNADEEKDLNINSEPVERDNNSKKYFTLNLNLNKPQKRNKKSVKHKRSSDDGDSLFIEDDDSILDIESLFTEYIDDDEDSLLKFDGNSTEALAFLLRAKDQAAKEKTVVENKQSNTKNIPVEKKKRCY